MDVAEEGQATENNSKLSGSSHCDNLLFTNPGTHIAQPPTHACGPDRHARESKHTHTHTHADVCVYSEVGLNICHTCMEAHIKENEWVRFMQNTQQPKHKNMK